MKFQDSHTRNYSAMLKMYEIPYLPTRLSRAIIQSKHTFNFNQ